MMEWGHMFAQAVALTMLSWGVFKQYGLHWSQIVLGAVVLINFWIP